MICLCHSIGLLEIEDSSTLRVFVEMVASPGSEELESEALSQETQLPETETLRVPSSPEYQLLALVHERAPESEWYQIRNHHSRSFYLVMIPGICSSSLWIGGVSMEGREGDGVVM